MSRVVAILALAGILAGGASALLGAAAVASWIWGATTAMALAPLLWAVFVDLRKGKIGVDVIALLAMIGCLALGQFLAGAIIALMLSGGQTLEAFAGDRAERELHRLIALAPREVHRLEEGVWTTRPVDAVVPGDLLLVKPGETVPVDGLVEGDTAVLDESNLTGESRPVEHLESDRLASGTVNAGGPFLLRAVASAADSTYAAIVRLVEEARQARAPFTRLADRYAVYFLPLSLAVAGGAWALSGDPLRALAVLVVATPCPLILAAPVALVAGISRAASRGVLIKGGGALEALSRAEILLLDKTGTITTGHPTLQTVETFSELPSEEVLRLAASLDQVSLHVFASAVVRSARERGIALAFPTAVEEIAGAGIRGVVGERGVALGRLDWVLADPGLRRDPAVRRVRRESSLEGGTPVFVAVDGRLAGALILYDPMRPDCVATIRSLRRAGIRRVVLVSGDRPEVAAVVGGAVGADLVLAERDPEEKVEAVLAERKHGPTVMVGDGVNDAPALAAADVGVAMGARGASAASEAAHIVLTVDRLDRLGEAKAIARRSLGIARESVVAGMALSLAGMIAAAFGKLPPIAGAVAQEAIDVLVILNALRALVYRVPKVEAGAMGESERTREEHRQLLPGVEGLRRTADRLEGMSPEALRAELVEARRFLLDELLPHDEREDAEVYPLVAARIGGDDPTAPMERMHLEIRHHALLLGRMLDELPPGEVAGDDLRDLRRVLYGLHAILRLHFAQEEQQYLPLLEAATPARRGGRAGRKT